MEAGSTISPRAVTRRAEPATSAADDFIARHELFEPDAEGIVRLPVLDRGTLIVPPRPRAAALCGALGESDHAELEGVHVLRHRDATGGDALLLVLPRVDADALAIRDPDCVARELYGLPTASAHAYAEAVARQLAPGAPILRRAWRALRRTTRAPGAYLGLALEQLSREMTATALRTAVDRELGYGGVTGARFLDDWVTSEPALRAGAVATLAAAARGEEAEPPRAARAVRALPTRQLHITAGNAPLVPLLSCARALATKSAAVIKMPADSVVAGAALAVALRFADPEHPLTRFTSVAYWRGGDERVEANLFDPARFDRVVVWGAPEAVRSVTARSPVKTVAFHPRYAVSFLGGRALEGDLEAVARRGAADALVWNQRACISSLVHYVETDEKTARDYARALGAELARWDTAHPVAHDRETLGALRRARRGVLAGGTWYANGARGAPRSAAVYLGGPFDVSAHPMSRVVVVRRVERLEDALGLLHQGVSQVGVAPEARRRELRDRICARGVSGVPPLGEADVAFEGMPHDGLRPLSELVSWVVG